MRTVVVLALFNGKWGVKKKEDRTSKKPLDHSEGATEGKIGRDGQKIIPHTKDEDGRRQVPPFMQALDQVKVGRRWDAIF